MPRLRNAFPVALALLSIVSLSGCGIIAPLFGLNRFKVEYDTGATPKALSRATDLSLRYDASKGLGNWVCSITPSRFVLPVNQVFFFPSKDSGQSGHLEVTDSGRYWNTGDATLYLADFSDPGAAKTYSPQITPGLSDYSHLLVNVKFGHNTVRIEDTDGTSKTFTNQADIIIPLPADYEGKTLAVESADNLRAGNELHCSEATAMANVAYPGAEPAAWIFGNADSTSIWTSPIGEGAGINIGMNVDWYHAMAGQSVSILRGPFDGLSLPPVFGEAVVSVTFDTEGLIQVYAGADNLPYTEDDRFVFAPEFWKRVTVSCLVK